MTWTLIPQTVKIDGCETTQTVKEIKFAPVEDRKTGDLRYVRLKYRMLQVVLADDHGYQLKVKSAALASGLRYTLQHPDTKEYPKIKVGEGKRAVIIPDTLAEPVTVPGRKDHFDTVGDFRRAVTRMLGDRMTDLVVNLLHD